VSVRAAVALVAVAMVQGMLFVVHVRVHRLGRRGEAARLPGKGQKPHPKHVESRQHRPDRRQDEKQDVLGLWMTRANAAAGSRPSSKTR